MRYSAIRWARIAYWNLWSATRLLLVLAVVAVWLHWGLDVNVPSTYVRAEVLGGLFILFILSALFSAARLFLRLLFLPLCIVLVLNSFVYDGVRHMLRQALGSRVACFEELFALAGELVFFVKLADSIISVIKTCCRI